MLPGSDVFLSLVTFYSAGIFIFTNDKCLTMPRKDDDHAWKLK